MPAIGQSMEPSGARYRLTAGVLADQGKLAPAGTMYAEALAIRREIGNKSGVGTSLSHSSPGDASRPRATR